MSLGVGEARRVRICATAEGVRVIADLRAFRRGRGLRVVAVGVML